MRLEISREVLAGIRAATAAAHPLEACGLLFGDEGRISGWQEARNVAERPDIEFEIDPAALFAALRAERADGPRLIGYWHSHPNGDVEPSQRDAEMADIDGKVWVIVAGDDIAAWLAVERPAYNWVEHSVDQRDGQSAARLGLSHIIRDFQHVPMATGEVRHLIPRDKIDEDMVPLIAAAGYPAIAPILNDLMRWTADGNWPVAGPLIDYLATIGEPMVEPVRRVLRGNDGGHKWMCMHFIVRRLPRSAQLELVDDLHALAEGPSNDDLLEGAGVEAREILAGLAESGA
jgi:proteasome lid subunit RPN8/RPN11